MPEPAPKHIDFDAWSSLAHSDPNAFEALRAQFIDEFIRRAPPQRQQRLRCLQWRIDQIRRTSRTPLAACLRLSSMMWDTVVGKYGLLETLNQGVNGGDPRSCGLADVPAEPPVRTASILPFSPRRR